MIRTGETLLRYAAESNRGEQPWTAVLQHLRMVEDVWLEMGVATLRFHPTKFSMRHFDKNAYSQMIVSLAAQVLSGSVAMIIQDAISDRTVKLPIKKSMYNHLANLCETWDTLFNITIGKD